MPWRIAQDGSVTSIDRDDHVSPNFRLRELCHPDTPFPPRLYDRMFRLCALLEQVRAAVNTPIKVTSAFRSIEQNARCGGAPHSLHLAGLAADFRAWHPPDRAMQDAATLRAHEWLLDHADTLMLGGLGLYEPHEGRPRRIHADLRARAPGTRLRRWTGRA